VMGQSHPLNPKPDRLSFYVPSGMERLSDSTSRRRSRRSGVVGGERSVTILESAFDGFLRHRVRLSNRGRSADSL
jgi:hypothetical protein